MLKTPSNPLIVDQRRLPLAAPRQGKNEFSLWVCVRADRTTEIGRVAAGTTTYEQVFDGIVGLAPDKYRANRA